VPVLGEPHLQRLLAVCSGKDFHARRDTPSSCCWSMPARAAPSWAGMRLDAADFDDDVIRVLGKGGRQRTLPLAARPAWRLTAICASGDRL
jgi:site-specific recombinase XerC